MSTTALNDSTLGTEREVFSFTLVLDGIKEITDELESAILDAGCDDALLSSCDGVVSLDFDRQASSMMEAITSAVRAVEQCGLDIRVRKVVPPGHHAIQMMNHYLALRHDEPELLAMALPNLKRGAQ
jgi:hypothetical protein